MNADAQSLAKLRWKPVSKRKRKQWSKEMHSKKRAKKALLPPAVIEQRRLQRLDYKRRHTAQRHITSLGLAGSYTSEQWDALKEKQKHLCARCGKRTFLTADHIIPISRWVDWISEHPEIVYQCNDIDNIQGLCGSCNSSKGSRLSTDAPLA